MFRCDWIPRLGLAEPTEVHHTDQAPSDLPSPPISRTLGGQRRLDRRRNA
jgi:hypothetical protein